MWHSCVWLYTIFQIRVHLSQYFKGLFNVLQLRISCLMKANSHLQKCNAIVFWLCRVAKSVCLFHNTSAVKSFWFTSTGQGYDRTQTAAPRTFLKVTYESHISREAHFRPEYMMWSMEVYWRSVEGLWGFQIVRLFLVTIKFPRFNTAQSQIIPVRAISFVGQRWGTVYDQSQFICVCVKWPKFEYLYYYNKKSGQPCL